MTPIPSKKSHAILWLFIAILFISFNMRAAITAIGPVLDFIKQQYHLNDTLAGLLGSLPLLIFAIVSPFVSHCSARISPIVTMQIGIILIALGIILRSFTGISGIFIGTAILSSGIAIANVLQPAIIKQNFPQNSGTMISIYTTAMCVTSALGSGLSLPLHETWGLGLQKSLAVWAILALITALILIPSVRNFHHQKLSKTQLKQRNKNINNSIWRNKIAWAVTFYMGIQSLIFYSLVNWLPKILFSYGMDAHFTSIMIFILQIISIPATLGIPILAGKYAGQRALAWIVCAFYLLGLSLSWLYPNKISIVIAMISLSLGMGGAISLAISFIHLRTSNSTRSVQLSGMSQSFGYLLAACGPILFGVIYEYQKTWHLPLIILIALALSMGLLAMIAGNAKSMID